MRIIVFGATGGTGKLIVSQALERSHRVTAFARAPEKLGLNHPTLTLYQGDALNPADVEAAVRGHDAVVCALGAPANKTGVIRSEGTRNIIHAMRKAGIRRLVTQTSLGYGDSKATLKRTPFVFRTFIVPILLKEGFADHALQEEHVKASGLDWVIVRPGNLTHGPRTRAYRHAFAATDKEITVNVSRADVADFVLEQLASDAYLHQTPGISY